ncbi:MAG: hypothetical protein ABJB93_10430 [Gaiellales bacterium]
MSGERGQATVELVAVAVMAAVIAVGLAALLALWAAQGRAQGIADQAAVLVAEQRPLPASLRREADIRVRGRTLVVTLPVRLAGGLGSTDAVARAALP